MQMASLPIPEGDPNASSWIEDQSMLIQETIADLTELQAQVEHARHHALEEDGPNSALDEVLDQTSAELGTWIENVLDLGVSEGLDDEPYERVSSSVLEDELE